MALLSVAWQYCKLISSFSFKNQVNTTFLNMPQVEIPQQSQLYFSLSGAAVLGIVYSITDKDEKIGNNFTARSTTQNGANSGDQNETGNNFTTEFLQIVTTPGTMVIRIMPQIL